MSTKRIIEKWYKLLEFPTCYDIPFYNALESINIPDTLTIDDYDTESEASVYHFLAFLYFCEETETRYNELGIGRDILMATLADLRRWTDTWSAIKGELVLGEHAWLKNHLCARLFRLGSLQFALGKAHQDVPEKSLCKGDMVIDVHIPANTDLSSEACEASFDQAKAFFARYFPHYEYRYFTCHSWMLDDRLKQVMKPDSKILAFQDRFDVVHNDPSNDLLRYLFRWDITEETLSTAKPTSGAAAKVKTRVLAGESFQISFGILK